MRKLILSAILSMLALHICAQNLTDNYQQVLNLGEWLEYDQALAALEDLPDGSLSQYYKIKLLLLTGNYHDAIEASSYFMQHWAEAAVGINCQWIRAYSLKKIGLYNDALFDFLELSRRDSLLSDIAWINAAYCYQQEGFKEASDDILDSLSRLSANNQDKVLLISLLKEQLQLSPGAVSKTLNKGSIYQAGRLIGRRKYQEAHSLLSRFIRYNKGSRHLGQAQYLIGKCLERQDKLTLAAQAYIKAPELQSGSEWSDDALFRAGWCYYKLKNNSRALNIWQDVTIRFPGSDFYEAALFWQGKVLHDMGDDLSSEEKYRELSNAYKYTYYGLRAREKLNDYIQPQDSVSSAEMEQVVLFDPSATEQTFDSDNWIRDHRPYRQASRLVELGIIDDARKLAEGLRKISWDDPIALHYLGQLYSQAGMDPQAIYCAKRSFELWIGPKPKSLLETLYPKRYLYSIGKSIKEHPLEAALVLSVMRQESKFVAGARSSAGARGLMQIMPKTGKRLSGLKKFEKNTLYHPGNSIEYGTKFLANLLRQFNGSLIPALAAYNAGPQRVKKWLKSERCRQDHDYLLEEIPFLETRNYVKKVMVGYYIYRWLLLEEKI